MRTIVSPADAGAASAVAMVGKVNRAHFERSVDAHKSIVTIATIGHNRAAIELGAVMVIRDGHTDVSAAKGGEPFPNHLREEYLNRARMMTARKGQIICAEGTESRDVYLICSGLVQFSLLSSHGREVILREMPPGRIFGELAAVDHRPRSASAVAKEDCQLAHMSGDSFVAYLGEVPQAGLWMVNQLAALLRDMTDRAFAMATLPVATRVQAELIRLADAESGVLRAEDTRTILKMPTHIDLAARIGTHREAVSRELGALTREGIVRQVGRQMHILSYDSLTSLYDRVRR